MNKHSGKATHDLANHLKAKNTRVRKLVCWSAITLNLNKKTTVLVLITFLLKKGPGRFHGIAGNAKNNGNDIKFHKNDQTLNQTKEDIDKLHLGKI